MHFNKHTFTYIGADFEDCGDNTDLLSLWLLLNTTFQRVELQCHYSIMTYLIMEMNSCLSCSDSIDLSRQQRGSDPIHLIRSL